MAFVSASQFGVVGHDGVPLLELLRCHGGHLLGLRRESEKTTMPREERVQPASVKASTTPLHGIDVPTEQGCQARNPSGIVIRRRAAMIVYRAPP